MLGNGVGGICRHVEYMDLPSGMPHIDIIEAGATKCDIAHPECVKAVDDRGVDRVIHKNTHATEACRQFDGVFIQLCFEKLDIQSGIGCVSRKGCFVVWFCIKKSYFHVKASLKCFFAVAITTKVSIAYFFLFIKGFYKNYLSIIGNARSESKTDSNPCAIFLKISGASGMFDGESTLALCNSTDIPEKERASVASDIPKALGSWAAAQHPFPTSRSAEITAADAGERCLVIGAHIAPKKQTVAHTDSNVSAALDSCAESEKPLPSKFPIAVALCGEFWFLVRIPRIMADRI